MSAESGVGPLREDAQRSALWSACVLEYIEDHPLAFVNGSAGYGTSIHRSVAYCRCHEDLPYLTVMGTAASE